MSFGEALRSFSNSIDVLREDEFERVLFAAREYLAENFAVVTVDRLAEVVSEGQQKLAPTFTDTEYDLYPVRTADGEPNGLSAAAFTSKRKMWVTPSSEEKYETLTTAGARIERWNPDSPAELPRFLRVTDEHGNAMGERSRTLISIPIKRRNMTTAVVYFESEDLLLPSDRAKEEFEKIAKALARLYDLKTFDKETHDATAEEIATLSKVSRNRYDWRALPSLFWAYPGSGDADVLKIIENALAQGARDHRYTIDDWGKNHSGGRIPDDIERKIRSAAFFVAYLSQPDGEDEDGRPQYADNPNVLYEAGVFQGLAADSTSGTKHWLLIREPASPQAPFDIMTVNTLIVDRDDTGDLDGGKFGTRVRERLAFFDRERA